jgi:hypothetical protein
MRTKMGGVHSVQRIFSFRGMALNTVCCKIEVQKVAIKNPESCSRKST